MKKMKKVKTYSAKTVKNKHKCKIYFQNIEHSGANNV